ncbi:lytic murein transglycosylase [Plantactinospora sp. GCM10030261]|uniref:lytic murein transglycosylase n=1 Tax=Plantactinospora sp. GCM10030261 TaxID=3273420 RepID=UPI00362328C6
MGNTRHVVDGENTPGTRRLRPAIPEQRPPAEPEEPTAESDEVAAEPAPPTAEAQPPASEAATPAADAETPANAAEAQTPAAEAGMPATETTPRRGRRRRVRFARAARRVPPPRQLAVTSVRAVRDWAGRPSGRVGVPALLLLALVAATGAAGVLIVPATARSPRPAAVASPNQSAPPSAPALSAPATAGPIPTASVGAAPTGTTPPPGAGAGGRPADALADWARQTNARTGVPPVAMQAYGYAELVVGRTTPGCSLTWPTLAAIGKVESDHGAVNQSLLQPDGTVQPPIIGLPLDGKGDRQRIADTDLGELDGDRQFDRAVGPMQFIPSTWRTSGVDADNDGRKDPQDIDDAALAAANYLCANGRNLSIPEDWWRAVLSYNDVQPYAQAVYETANRYGSQSRT